MSPPPSTPTPRRFLLPKRGTQSSQTPTALPRFHSTPRFASSSVPRLTQARTGVDIEDVEEVGDHSQETSQHSSGDEDEQPTPKKHDLLHDSIEIESDDSLPLQNGSLAISDHESDTQEPGFIDREMSTSPRAPYQSSPIEEREAKRRRVSISPMLESSPLEEEDNYAPDGIQEEMHQRDRTPTQDSTQSIQDAIPVQDESKALQQPTFRAPPRFKPVELDLTMEGLPAAFSPQRRGAKYIAGGLAAELQGWLSEVKGWEGVVPATTLTTKVTVEEIRPGRRMYLVKCHTGNTQGKRYLLAGEGKLTGLGQRMPVSVGSIVEVGQPVWDVELDGEIWTVACDWGVSKELGEQ
ncbi:uncharacterized protein FTOL_04861 [Fusarium torulosum]|uniref:Uncharacterized protein n=1 Tax=Fusarium torulosum TaxID=33205 RepID=A0AAE8M6L3_9HYPO|nr:uncharacterized protein FTOL_04861 [Fusarium torulosum]